MALWGNTDAQVSAPKIVVRTDGDVATSNTARLGTTQYGNTVFAVSAAELQNRPPVSTSVATVTVTNPGSGFTARPTVSFTGAATTNATATATAKVVSIAVGDAAGTGYVPGDILSVTGTGTAASANVSSTKVVGAVVGTTAGTGYTNGDVVTVSGGTGTSATLTVTTDGTGVPTSLVITTAGSYTANPSLDEAATTGGSGADLAVDLVMGVNALTLRAAGSYTTIPTLNENALTGGTGTGATADLVMGVNTVTVTNGGAGYTAAPSVVFGGAGGIDATGTAVLTSTAGSEASKVAHAGWVVRKDRGNGRVQYETLVAMGSIQGDGEDDTKLPE